MTAAASDAPKILHVDDNEANQYAATRILQRAGFTVLTASNGQDALAMVKTESPLVVLLDVNLPDMSGYEICRRIKGDPESSTAVLQMSATFVKSEDQVRGLQGGADGYITEPVDPEVLVATVKAQVRIRIAEIERTKAQRAAELANQRLKVLADTSQLLSEAADQDAAIEQILSLVIPRWADCGSIVLFASPVSRDVCVFKHCDAERANLLEKLLRRYPADAEHPKISAFLKTGEAELIAPVTDDWLAQNARGADHLVLVKGQGFRSLLRAPIISRSKVLGIFWLAFCSEKQFDQSDLSFVDELAKRIAVEVDNVRLYQQSQRHNRMKDEFLATLAHELRNPLAPIRNATELMGHCLSNPDEIDRLRKIAQRQVHNVSRIIDDLTDIARIENGKLTMRLEKLDVVEATRLAAQSCSEAIKARGHELKLVLPGEPFYIEADPTRFEQVVCNLIHNSAKYTPDLGTIAVTVEARLDDVLVRIRDNGIGISPELLPRIFELFAQAPQSLDRPQGGLGIGLTIARHLVQLHHGSISAKSAGEGKGTEFIVRLPLSREQTPSASKSSSPARSRGRQKIVLVEDNDDSRETLQQIIEIWGHEVVVAETGTRGIEAILKHKPDIAFVDIGLPEVDGFAVANAVRADPGCSKIVMIALTGYGQDKDREKTREAGFNSHLVKPVDMDVLQRVINAEYDLA